MRLTKNAASSILHIVSQTCGDTEVWLFGSLVDDHKKGGDIDLYIESETEIQMMEQLRLMSKLQRALGFRKIDLIIRTPNSPERPIFQTAKKTGIRL